MMWGEKEKRVDVKGEGEENALEGREVKHKHCVIVHNPIII